MGAAGERKGARSFVGRVGGSCGITKRGKIVRREGRRELRKNENGRNRSLGGSAGENRRGDQRGRVTWEPISRRKAGVK